ncbi:MAG: cyclic nucleotide-binding domain-containing protein [Spirochaetales bacterium]|jgi:CRP/FNR family cyclic AMP-dependent transcriptional regulator|nr:cyclic nucleotide-binding domain-containing protein [Exilispira sp.]NMC66759.1 cyclic nucleotide-binding domain-containing protein [Spirochaetales bacterium]
MSKITEDFIKFGFEGESGLTAEFIQKYSIKFPKNKIVFHEGERSSDVYYILEGSVFVTKKMHDTYKVLTYLEKGDIFGEMGVLEETIRSATIITREDSTFLKFTKEEFKEILKIHPRWIDKIIQDMSERIIKMIQKL